MKVFHCRGLCGVVRWMGSGDAQLSPGIGKQELRGQFGGPAVTSDSASI